MSDIERVYKEMILDLYNNPLHKGVLDDYDATAQDVSTSCGDDITVYLKFDQNNRITNITHNGYGCAISQAAVSLVTDAAKGKTKEEIMAMGKANVFALLGIEISHARLECALLGLKTLQKALTK